MANQFSDFKFTVNPEACASIHDEGIVILHLGSGKVYSSNETGASIWRRVEQQLPLETITEHLSTEYRIALSTSRKHVAAFLNEMEQHELIQREVVS